MKADLGGTNILDPLQNILSIPPLPDFPRQVFILTDGGKSHQTISDRLTEGHPNISNLSLFCLPFCEYINL